MPRALLLFSTLCAAHRAVHGLEYASGWLLRPSVGANASWTNFLFQAPHDESLKAAQMGIPTLYSLDWLVQDTARADPKTGLCPTKIPRFKDRTCPTIRPDWRSHWDKTLVWLQPFIANRTYFGVFLGDERMWAGLELSNVSTIASYIKQTWPGAVVYMNEAQDVVHCNFNRLGDAAFAPGECVPEAVDWFGYDYYVRRAEARTA